MKKMIWPSARLLVPFAMAASCSHAFASPANEEQDLEFYRVRVPATQASCAEDARDLAIRFLGMTGISPVNAKCSATTRISADGKDYVIHTLDFQYPSANAPRYHTFHFGHSDALSDSQSRYYGYYRTFEACVSDLSKRSEEFETHTGLKTLSASCARSQSSMEVSYVLTLDSFGEQDPKQRLYAVNTQVSPYLKQDLSEELRRIVLQNGGKIVGTSGKHIYFYSADFFRLEKMSFGFFDDQESCALQEVAARAILEKAEAQPFYLGCLAILPSGSAKKNLVSLWNAPKMLSSHAVDDRYYSLEECENDKARNLSSMEDSGRPVLGAVCRPDDLMSASPQYYIMEIYFHE